MSISHCYCYLVIKKANFTLVISCNGQEWQLEMTSSGHDLQFNIATHI